MSGYIYLITNKLNQKKYVGQTHKTIQERYKEHLKTAQRANTRHLYLAMNKYGVDNFTVQELEYVADDSQLDSREQYWIKYYDSYYNGYNETLGGSGYIKYDYTEIYNYYISHQHHTKETADYFDCDISVVLSARRHYNDNPSEWFISENIQQQILQEVIDEKTDNEIAHQFNIHPDSVRRIKRKNNIPKNFYQKEKQAKRIVGIEKSTGKQHHFKSIRDAARWLGNINYHQNINACLHKRQKTAYGYEWFYE